MAPKRKAPARRAPARKSTRRTSAPRDGQNLLVNAYFEARKTLDAANESVMSYVINIDPKTANLVGGAGVTFYDGGAGNGTQLTGATQKLTYPMYTKMSDIFNQYRVNSAAVKVRVDGTCGLENALITSNDKGIEDAVSTMASAVTGAHKTHSMSASKREAKYAIKTSGQERDYLNTNPGTAQIDAEKKYIKIFQKLPVGTATCEHQIQVTLSLSLKDTKNLN